jgi:hypothetical protein
LKLVAKFDAPEFSTSSRALGAGRAAANRAFSLLVALDCYIASAHVDNLCPSTWGGGHFLFFLKRGWLTALLAEKRGATLFLTGVENTVLVHKKFIFHILLMVFFLMNFIRWAPHVLRGTHYGCPHQKHYRYD